MIVELGVIASGVEIAGWGYLYSKTKRDAINKNLTRKTQIKEFPMFDKRIKKYLNAKPNKMQKLMANRIITFSRFLVYSKAFEYLVMALVDPKSRIKRDGNRWLVKARSLQAKVNTYRLSI